MVEMSQELLLQTKIDDLVASGKPEDLLSAAEVAMFDLRDSKQAFALFVKAEEAGDARAHNALALLYRNGTGVESSDDKAKEEVRKGAEAKDIDALVTTLMWIRSGYLQPTDENEDALLVYEIESHSGYAELDDATKAKIKAQPSQAEAVEEEGLDEATKRWVVGYYILAAVLAIAGTVITIVAAIQIKQPAWYALLAFFGPMFVYMMVPLLVKKHRYNETLFKIALGIGGLYVVAILVAAIAWYFAKS